jgi:putative ABC transport system substrate-binding protein
MRRREFIVGLAGTAAWPLAARAQQPVPVVGYVSARTPDGDTIYVGAFRKGLTEFGFVDGRNVTIEGRWADGQYDRLRPLCAELIGRRVALIAASSTASAFAAKAETATIPIVFVTAEDPVEIGLVPSLNRPPANITGLSMLSSELRPKMVELLRELKPRTMTIFMLANPNLSGIAAQTRDTQAAVRAVGLQFHLLKASTPSEIDAAFASLSGQQETALIVASDPFLTGQHKQIASLAARYAVPAVYPWREYVTDGGLLSYGSSQAASYRQAGIYAGRILKGERPADLPVMLPTKFEMVINLKTAKALGIEVPETLLATADEVIK